MNLTNKQRGANVRRNLRRWWKRLLLLMVGWMLLCMAFVAGLAFYAQANHLSSRKVQSLAYGCGVFMGISLVVVGLTVLVIADRKKVE